MGIRGVKSKVKREYNNQGILIKKQCTVCKRMLPVEDFQKESKVKDGYKSKCKSCVNKEYIERSKNKDKDLHIETITPEVKTEVYGIIYMVFNIHSRRYYIGQTTRSFDDRYPNGWIQEHIHKKEVQEDLNKYGKDSFGIVKLFDIAYNKEHLDLLEAHYIDKFNSYNNGYNNTRGNIF